MSKLSKRDVDLLKETHIAFLATINRDGSPQLTPVWVDTDGEAVLCNTVKGRLKELNLRRDPRVALVVVDPTKPFERKVVLSGKAKLEERGAKEHIDALAKKYMGVDEYPFLQPGDVRIKVIIDPERVGG